MLSVVANADRRTPRRVRNTTRLARARGARARASGKRLGGPDPELRHRRPLGLDGQFHYDVPAAPFPNSNYIGVDDFAYTADTTAPTPTLTVPANGSGTTDSTPAFSGNAGTVAGDRLGAGDLTVEIYSGNTVSGSPLQTLSADPNDSTGAYSVSPTTALANGTYTARATQSDAAANIGHSRANTFRVDTTAPTPTLTAPANGSATGDHTPAFSGNAGTAADDRLGPGALTVEIYSGNTATGSPVQTLSADPDDTTGAYSVSPTTGLPDGTYTARATQSDAAGNQGHSSANTFTVTSGLTENFDSVVPSDWTVENNSEPLGTTSWFQGGVFFPAHSGAPNSYAAADARNTAAVGTISDWLISPSISTLHNGDTWSFWTRTVADRRPDRLEFRLSTSGACGAGSGEFSVGEFETLLVEVNPTLATGGYPEDSTQYSGTLSGLPAGDSTGCFAFRYFVTEGGESNPNSTLIGVDEFAYSVRPDAPRRRPTTSRRSTRATARRRSTCSPTTPTPTATR